MSRSSEGYFGPGSRRRPNDGYSGGGGGGYRQYGDSYVGRRSSQDSYMRDRPRGGRSQGRGLMVNPWEGGMVPGSGGVGGRPLPGSAATPDIVASINQLSRMDNPESELALNILNAVLTNKEDSQWGGGQRGWEGGQKRRMDWDDQYGYGSGRGILPTPQMPPRKMPRRDNTGGAAYSWGVVGGFIPGRPVRGRGGPAGMKGKKIMPTKKMKVIPGGASKTDTGGTEKQGKPAAKTAEEGKGDTKSTAAEETAKAAEKGDAAKTEDTEDDKAEGTATGEAAESDAKDGAKTSAGETDPKKKELEPKKKKEECPVPLSYLRCHICHMHKFNNGSNFMDHVRSKKHRRMTVYYQEKIDSTLKMLKSQSWLKSQRHIVSMSKQRGRITRCETCECPIKGGQGPHLHLREHALVYHFTKCFTCKKKFTTRAEFEAHKLTFTHMKMQCNLDNIARDRFMRKTKKQGKDAIIPEQKSTEEFHEMVTQMQLNNLSTQVWNKDTIPIYDPAVPIGLNHLVKQSLFVCSVCPKKVSQTAREALEHTKTKEHYDCYLAHLKALEENKEKEETSDKENEGGSTTTVKKEEDAPKQEAKMKEETKVKEEKEIKKEDDDGGMKDMDNMQVIDEEVDQEDNEEEEEEEEKKAKDTQEEEKQSKVQEEEEMEEEADDVCVEEVGEDLEFCVEEVGEDLVEEEAFTEPPQADTKGEKSGVDDTVAAAEVKKPDDDKTTTTTSSDPPATPEAKTETSSTQDRPPTPETSPAPAPAPAPETQTKAPVKPAVSTPQTRQGRSRGRGRGRGAGGRRST